MARFIVDGDILLEGVTNFKFKRLAIDQFNKSWKVVGGLVMEEALKIVILFLVGYAIGAIVIRKGDDE